MILPAVFIFLVVIAHPSHGNRGLSPCELPSSWAGRWFESGERDAVIVTSKNITHKGECVTQKGDKYIFKDERHHCYRCAVMHQKHENVIQYKESFCESTLGRRPLDLCYHITADSPLRSLFRLDIETFEECPLEGAFSFTYSRGHGLCEYPKSSLSQCSDKSKLVFRYQACADIKGSESNVEEVQCVAQWKEGSTFFFLGFLNHSHVLPSDYEGRFRCFAYQNIYEGFLVSQSGEAVCSLYSAKEGDRTMTLKRVHNFDESCLLPDWLHDPKSTNLYENLNGTTKFHLTTNSVVITKKHSNDGSLRFGGQSRSKLTLNCNSIESRDDVTKFARMVMQVNFDCESGFVCLEMERKSSNILNLRIGRFSRNQDEACHTQLFFDHNIPKTTIIDTHGGSRRCPLVGKYFLKRVETEVDRFTFETCGPGGIERNTLMFGCSGESEFNLVSRCRQNLDDPILANNHFKEFVSEDVFSCLGGWKDSFETNPLNDVITTKEVGQLSPQMVTELTFVQSTQFLIVEDANTRKVCLQLKSTPDGDKTEMIASIDECPDSKISMSESRRRTLKNEKLVGTFTLGRQSECAQALATANRGTQLPKFGVFNVILTLTLHFFPN